MATGRPGGPRELQEEVIKAGWCASCGLCAALCPYIKCAGDRVKVVYPCGRETGACFGTCPRTELDVSALDRLVYGGERGDADLGPHQGIYYSRAAAVARACRAQYGGTTTALLTLALRLGLADGVVAVQTDGEGRPRSRVYQDPEEVKFCAGSSYLAAPSLAALAEARRAGLARVAVVGRPCQVEALRRWEAASGNDGGFWLPCASLIVGLFCFWALSAEFLAYLHQKVGRRINRTDVPPEVMLVRTPEREWRLPLEEVRPFVRPACQVCFDPTAEWADLSVGSTEADPGWNTLIVRTDRGRRLVEEGVKMGFLELEPYPAERMSALRQAVRNKKRRVLAELEASSRAYLVLPPAYGRALGGG